VPRSRRNTHAQESVVVSTRTHAKALVRPLVVLILLAAAAGALATLTPSAGRAQPLLVAVVWGLAGLLALRWVVRPLLEWLTTSYTVTDRRVVGRHGVWRRWRQSVPLAHVSAVDYEQGIVDRVVGSGTLVLSVAGDRPVELRDVPDVERLHARVDRLLADEARTRQMPTQGRHDRR